MSLKILFADDSMTAQNMGKKILTEAGYDVVAVSNGAAAVKKIAEQKPDIIILDVYMPGYSGLEVCEKVRASMDTLKTPVLLTVGKMEPYKPEDANRVRADGVIIKPFEASDLLAIVKRFEERISQTYAAEQTVLLRRSGEDGNVPAELPVEHPEPRPTTQPTLEVPDHMATSAAFSDLLGAEPVRSFESPVIPPVAAASPSAAAAPARASSEYDVPVSWRQEAEAPAPVAPVIAAPVAEAPIAPVPVAATPATASEIHVSPVAPTVSAAPASELSVEPAAPPARPQTIPVFQDAEPEPLTEEEHYEVVPTAAPPVPDIEIAKEPELQETAEETTRNTRAEEREPGLMPTIEPPAEPARVVVVPQAAPVIAIPTFEDSQHAREIPIAPAAELPIHAPHDNSPAATGMSDADFEARVAAAMAAYNQPAEAEPSQGSTSESVSTTFVEHASSLAPLDLHEQPIEAESGPVQAPKASEAVPSFVYTPATAHDESAGIATEPVAPVSAQPLQETARTSAIPEFRETSPLETSEILESLPNAAPVEAQIAQSQPEDHQHSIAQAVHRVMERLKPELVEEIMRELKSKK